MNNVIDITTRLKDDDTLQRMYSEVKRRSTKRPAPKGCKRWYHDSNPSVWLPIDGGAA